MKRPSFLLGPLVILVAGCGSSSSISAGNLYNRAAARVPGCTHAGKAITLPSRFPAKFPFPRGTTLTSEKPLIVAQHQIGLYGFVPSTGFSPTVTFFKKQVPANGFKLLDFEADQPHDSEGRYSGYGYIGIWQLRALPACPGAMTFAVSAEPLKGGK